MSETKSEFGPRVRGLRSPKGSSLSKIENGQMLPTCDALQKLAAGFAVDISVSDSDSDSVNAEGPSHEIL